MKIAFTSKGTTWDSNMDERFGRTEFILLYDEETNELNHYDNRHIANEAHGAGPKTAQKLCEHSPDILITGNGPGNNAQEIINMAKINIYIGARGMTVKKAYEQYKNCDLIKL